MAGNKINFDPASNDPTPNDTAPSMNSGAGTRKQKGGFYEKSNLNGSATFNVYFQWVHSFIFSYKSSYFNG